MSSRMEGMGNEANERWKKNRDTRRKIRKEADGLEKRQVDRYWKEKKPGTEKCR